MITTLNQIRAHGPCADGWRKLLAHLGKTCADDEPLPITTVLDSNGLDDALWCLRAVPGHDREKRLYAVWCARQVQHLLTDPRSMAALDVAERHANGLASDDELDAAWDAARAAAGAAAWDAVWDAARAAAGAAARAAAGDAAWDAAGDAAGDAAWDAAGDAAWDAAMDAQAAELRRVCAQVLGRLA
jgi:hypothetical protein